jgi:hypothetical protein
MQAATLALADARAGVLVTLTSFAGSLGLVLFAASRLPAGAAGRLAGLTALTLVALGAAAWSWGDVVEAVIQARAGALWLMPLGAMAGAACAVPTQLALRACAQAGARARAACAIGYLVALAGSPVIAAVCVLFADFRVLGVVAATIGVAATLLSIRAARAAQAGARA